MDGNSSIRELKGVGEKTAGLLNSLGIYTVEDLLEYYPRNYDIYEEPVSPAEVREGVRQAVRFRLVTQPVRSGSQKMPVVMMKVQGPGRLLYLLWYHMPYLKNSLKTGEVYVFRGTAVLKNGRLQMEQPEIFTDEQYQEKLYAMQPIYPLRTGVSNKLLVRLMEQALADRDLCTEFLPEDLREKYHLAEYNFALEQIHFPKNTQSMLCARQRLVFDEFFLFSLAVLQMKDRSEKSKNRYPMTPGPECETLIHALPYTLTAAQQRTWREIQADLASDHTMNRLVQGDVGSGKTILAALALLMTAKQGYQCCLMAPTEILAAQHAQVLENLLEPFGVRVTLLTGDLKASKKRSVQAMIAAHETDVIVGTHALITDRVTYDRLALVITDEQHRFGVAAREQLSGKGTDVHTLVMSATPIPRTLAIILYGDLDISIVDELPAKRLPIKNCVVDTSWRKQAWHFLEGQVREGHQAYVICPMVEKSEVLEAENVTDYAALLREQMAKEIRIGVLHGRMKPKEKNAVMKEFLAGGIDILVSTTVVEVGVDVPNATAMMIEDAQRFGLAQLHQLRGRVGRSDLQSYCIFVNTSGKEDAQERLEVLLHSNDGFYIANEDLRLRGPGDLFGIRQSGMIEFKLGDLYEDLDILKEAAEAAKVFSQEEDGRYAACTPAIMDRMKRYMKYYGESIIL